MSGLSSYARTLALTYLFTGDAATRPSAWHFSLHKGTLDPALPGDSEVTTADDANYVRQSGTLTASGDDATSSSALSWSIDAGATAFTVTAVGVWDAATGGNFLGYAPVVVTAEPGGTVAFASGSFKLQLLDQC